MKHLQTLTALVALLFTSHVYSQQNNEINWGWSDTYGNNYNSVANRLVVQDGYMYIAGTFMGELPIQGDTLISSPTEEKPFVAKFDTNGVKIWAKRLDWGNKVNSLRVDSNGDVRVLCDGGLIVIYSGLDGSYLVQYAIPESVADIHGLLSDETVIDFDLDNVDNMYVLSKKEEMQTGTAFSKISVYSTPNNTISSLLWADTVELGLFPSPFGEGPKTMSLDSNFNVYVTGMTSDITLALVGGNVINSGMGSPEMYTIKYNTNGFAEWLTTTPTMSTDLMHSGINMVDSSLYLTGYNYFDEVYHGDTVTMDTTNQQQIILLKYKLDGTYLWVKGYPLETKSLKTFPNASWGALGNEVQITDNGEVYLRGSFTGSIVFANDTLVEDTSVVVLNHIADDVFIAKLDPNGNPIWGKYAGNSGGVGNETGDFWVDPATGHIHFVGYWADTNNLLKNTTPNDALKQIFIARQGGPSAVNVEEIEHESIRILVYPNPSKGLFRVSKPVNADNYEYSIMNIHGQVLIRGKLENPLEIIDLSDFTDGIYYLQTSIGTTKLLKQ